MSRVTIEKDRKLVFQKITVIFFLYDEIRCEKYRKIFLYVAGNKSLVSANESVKGQAVLNEHQG